MANLLSRVGGTLIGAIPGLSGVGGSIANGNLDLTPGGSLQNVATTQAKKVFSASPAPAAPAPTPLYTQATPNGNGQNPNGTYNQAQATGGAGGVAQSDPDLAAQYQDQVNQLQNQNGMIDGQLNNGLTSLQNSYNQGLQGLTEQQNLLQHQYDANKAQNTKDYASTANNARTQVRSQANALQRLLGMNGAGNSSAAYEQAPYAAALQGSQLINNAQSTYAKNAANADNNFAQTQLSAKQAKDKLDQSKASQEASLRQNVAQSHATLLDKIRTSQINAAMANGANYKTAQANQAGTQNDINSLLAQIQNLGKVAPIAYDPQSIQYQTPDMAQYSLDGMQAPQAAQSGQESNIDPSFLSLLSDPNKKRDPFGNLITS